jgi:DNA-binding beta-propeller fold protein YncE
MHRCRLLAHTTTIGQNINLIPDNTLTILATPKRPGRTPVPGQGNDSYAELRQLRARRTTVTPIATATGTPGKPINIGGIGRFTAETAIAITPDGKTAYIADGNHRTVIPVATATNTPGKPINIGGTAVAIAITPDGKTAYIATAAYIAGSCAGCPVGSVIPVATANGTPGKPINIGRIPKGIVIAP